jgi:SSU processome protein Utp24
VTTVVLDTNALTAPVQAGVRVFEELDRVVGDGDRVVPTPVVEELERLATGNGEPARAAAVGRDLVDRCRVVETRAAYADDAVVELATGAVPSSPTGEVTAGETPSLSRPRYAVTNDGPLRDRLLARDVRVIGLRGANTLAVTEP